MKKFKFKNPKRLSMTEKRGTGTVRTAFSIVLLPYAVVDRYSLVKNSGALLHLLSLRRNPIRHLQVSDQKVN